MTYTERRKLTRELIRQIRLFQVWDGPELRDRPDALRERNEALGQIRRELAKLEADHHSDLVAAMQTRTQKMGAA